MDAETPNELLSNRPIASGNGWSVAEFICRAGPEQRAYEERHETVAISAVLAGTFRYRTEAGTALLHPGALLLGQAGACFECGHDHSRGDRCIAFHYTPDYFAEIAASRAGASGFRFSHAMLPALRHLTPTVAGLEALAAAPKHERMEETAIALAETVLTALSGEAPQTVAPSPRDHRRIVAALRYIEENAAEPLSLDDMAGVACMSKYHFLRCFKRITGCAPYEYLLNLRLRRAAAWLRQGKAKVAAIAFESGFGDLSSFNREFRRVIGEAPNTYRRSA